MKAPGILLLAALGALDGLAGASGNSGLSFDCPRFDKFGNFGIRYRVPADTRLASYALHRTAVMPPQWNYTLFRDADATTDEHRVETCWTVGGACRRVGAGRRRSTLVGLCSRRGVQR